MLQTSGLTRTYRVGRDRVTALDGVDISVRQGEFVAVMGPSGCGKSTLLNLVGGLDRPTAGQVQLGGHDLATMSDEALAVLRRQTLGFIFQRHDLLPILTVQENVEFPLLLAGCALADRQRRAADLLAQVGLAEKAQHLPEELSGGQQQRVGIARALANHPAILLADEPTGNLDSATAGEILDLLAALVRQEGLTLVMVTHDAEDAARADRIIRLRDGHLVTEKDATP
ncbi:MAG: ABC transporter ATP-binding protein [Chloroflexota bacterium]|nr:ABC transporter ATP-binding protein [Chloroflexota bacterium]